MSKVAQDAGKPADQDGNDQGFDDIWDEIEKQDMAAKKPATQQIETDEDPGGEDPDDAGDGGEKPSASPKKPESDAVTGNEALTDEETDFDEAKLNEEVAKLQQKIRSAEGRLAKQESESLRNSVATMRDEIKKLQEIQKSIAQPDKDDKAKAASTKSSGGNEEVIPTGFTKEEWTAYQADYPEYADAVLRQDKALRKDLVDAKQRLEKIEKADTEKQYEVARKEFNAGIIKAHPDYEQIETQEADKVLAFIDAQEDPIEREVLRSIVERGSQQQIIGLVTRYKTWRDGPKPDATKQQTNTQTNDTTKKRIAGATAVPGRGGSRPDLNKSGAPDKDDFDGAWDELEKAGR